MNSTPMRGSPFKNLLHVARPLNLCVFRYRPAIMPNSTTLSYLKYYNYVVFMVMFVNPSLSPPDHEINQTRASH